MGTVGAVEGSTGPHGRDTGPAAGPAALRLRLCDGFILHSCLLQRGPLSLGQGGEPKAEDLHHSFICSVCSRRHPKLREQGTTRPRLPDCSRVVESLRDVLKGSGWQALPRHAPPKTVWSAEALEEEAQCHHSMGRTPSFTCAAGGHQSRSCGPHGEGAQAVFAQPAEARPGALCG